MVIELLQPISEGTSWKEYLDKKGEGVQHLGFQVVDPDKTSRELEKAGYGPVSDRQGLQDYRDILSASQERILKLIQEGKTVDEIINIDPTRGLFKGGESWLEPKYFVYTVYQDLLKNRK